MIGIQPFKSITQEEYKEIVKNIDGFRDMSYNEQDLATDQAMWKFVFKEEYPFKKSLHQMIDVENPFYTRRINYE